MNDGHGAGSSGSISAEDALKLLFPDAAVLSQLERLRIVAGNRIKGTLAGKRRSAHLGGSQEFADYRPYVPGDDIRRIDWNVYGRTGRAYMRQYWDEQELQAHLYIDVSRSMQFGQGSANKLAYALRLAASIGYAALCAEDRVSVNLYSNELEQQLPMLRGRTSSTKLFQFMAEALRKRTAGKDEIDAGLNSIAVAEEVSSNMAEPFMKPGSMPRRSGTTWLFTDAMFESGAEEALLSFIAAGQKVVLIHLLSPEEIDPSLSGELRLIDSELRTGKEVAVGHRLLADYRAEVDRFREELKRICADRGVDYMFVNTAAPLQETISGLLVSGALKD